MGIHIVGDNAAKLRALRTMLEPQFEVHCELFREARIGAADTDAIVLAVDLREVDNINALKHAAARLHKVRRRIFIIDQKSRVSIVQAYALGATHVITSPVKPARLLAALTDRDVPARDGNCPEEAALAGASSIAAMFKAVIAGTPVDVAASRDAGRKIADSVAEHGLNNWLETVRRHHEGTYQHCLLVTGVAVDFGLSLGMRRPDIERLYTAAMFHDIGKARIPLAVLDKPARLDPAERALIETHPVAGYDALNGVAGISPEVLDAVRHHHEYLDGSGYPDALCGNGIRDLVRMLTISDIFAALIEHRHYKPDMPRQQAYEILQGMNGKLEQPLVSAFREVALKR